jgi:hypothetical protein
MAMKINFSLLKVAIFVSLFFSFLISFYIYSDFDSIQLGYSQNNNFYVNSITSKATKKEQLNYINKVAKQNNENIYLVNSSNETGNFYSFIGNKSLFEKNFSNKTYPSFNKSASVKFLPYQKFGDHDLRAYFLASANKEKLKKITNELNAYGINADYSSNPFYSPTKLSIMLFGLVTLTDNSYNFLFIMLALGVIFICFFVNNKNLLEYSVKSINGYSKSKIFFNTFFNILKSTIIFMAIQLLGIIIFGSRVV